MSDLSLSSGFFLLPELARPNCWLYCVYVCPYGLSKYYLFVIMLLSPISLCGGTGMPDRELYRSGY